MAKMEEGAEQIMQAVRENRADMHAFVRQELFYFLRTNQLMQCYKNIIETEGYETAEDAYRKVIGYISVGVRRVKADTPNPAAPVAGPPAIGAGNVYFMRL